MPNKIVKQKEYIPYGRQFVTDEDIKEVLKILKSDYLTQGPVVEDFEKSLARFVKCEHSVAVNSGTSALHLACKALDLKKGDLVWTTPITFVASANCAKYCGADVDFVDIDLSNGLICIDKLEEKLLKARKIGNLPKVIIPVHLAGNSCDMKRIFNLSQKFGFKIIEDASHALGGSYLNNFVGACTYSHLTVFSFHPVKMITTGEGGMVTTNDDKIASKLYQLRTHGITKDPSLFEINAAGPWSYEQQILGFNYRMTDIQAALGRSQLKRLTEFVSIRRRILRIYEEELKDEPILFLKEKRDVVSSVHLVIIRLNNQSKDIHKKLFESLREELIGVQLHYIPVHLHPFYRRLGFYEGQFPNAELYGKSAMSLPVYPGLKDESIYRVIKTLKDLIKKLNIH